MEEYESGNSSHIFHHQSSYEKKWSLYPRSQTFCLVARQSLARKSIDLVANFQFAWLRASLSAHPASAEVVRVPRPTRNQRNSRKGGQGRVRCEAEDLSRDGLDAESGRPHRSQFSKETGGRGLRHEE